MLGENNPSPDPEDAGQYSYTYQNPSSLRHSVADALRLYHSISCIKLSVYMYIHPTMSQLPKHASCLTQHGRMAVMGGLVPGGLDISIRTPPNLLDEPDKSDRFVQRDLA